jgi:hypothetical protein
MKTFTTLVAALCFTANTEPLSLHLDHYVPNFTDGHHFTNNLSVITVSNAVTGATDTLMFSTDLTNWTAVAQIIVPGPVYSTSYLAPLNQPSGYFKLMEQRP